MSASGLFDAYLARLGCEREPPSAAALARIHRAQAERIPYETTWIHLGERRGIDPLASVDLIARHGRGGYCFHLNGALAALLVELGYSATLHRGGVHHGPPERADLGQHLVLLVHDLPTEANPGGTWYADTGLGDTLHEPLPLAVGTYHQGPVRLRLLRSDDGIGDWRLVHDADGAFNAMSFELAPTTVEACAPTHHRLSTDPGSRFVRLVTVQVRHPGGSTVVRGRVLSRRSAAGVERTVVADRDRWFALLAGELSLPLADLADGPALDRLWAHVAAAPLPDGLARPNGP